MGRGLVSKGVVGCEDEWRREWDRRRGGAVKHIQCAKGQDETTSNKHTREARQHTHRDQCQTRIQRPQQPPPPALPRAAQLAPLLQPHHLYVEPHRQRKEDHDEELLQPNPPHVDMHALQDLLRRRPRPAHSAAHELDHERHDVHGDEAQRQHGGADAEEGAHRQEEVDHAPEEHVVEGVDPQRRQQHEELGGQREA